MTGEDELLAALRQVYELPNDAAVRKQLGAVLPEATAQLFSSLKREGVEEAAEMLGRLAGLHVRAAKNKAPAKGE